MTTPERIPGRPPRRSRDDVVAAALAVLDERGMSELSMRNIAASIGVQASALYWHFPNKQTLLAAVADVVVSDAEPVSAADWRDAVADEAHDLRRRLLAVTDGAELVASSIALGLGGGRARRRVRDLLVDGGVPEGTASLAAAGIVHLVLGHTMIEQQHTQAVALGVDLAGADPDVTTAGGPEFEFALDALVRGLEPVRTR